MPNIFSIIQPPGVQEEENIVQLVTLRWVKCEMSLFKVKCSQPNISTKENINLTNRSTEKEFSKPHV